MASWLAGSGKEGREGCSTQYHPQPSKTSQTHLVSLGDEVLLFSTCSNHVIVELSLPPTVKWPWTSEFWFPHQEECHLPLPN